jgi:Mn2+/Fe2+ NRAMP family transporter
MRQRNHRLPLTEIIGPGVVAGASDNDPTTVGAVTVVGAETGYRLS